jgi:hypothetical protein
MSAPDQPFIYPYSLNPATERVYLLELANILEVIRWRASELETCAAEVRHSGTLGGIPVRHGLDSITGATRLIGTIEAFLAAYARASLILYPTAKSEQARGTHLRAVLGIDASLAPDRLKDRALRNGWMHLDEDIKSLAEDRNGRIAEGVVVPKETPWYAFVERGSIRMLNPEDLTIALPKRGVWSLRPYIHRCSDLQATVSFAISNPYRWECVDGVCGIAVGRRGKPEMWMIRSLGGGAKLEVQASSYNGVVGEFGRAVASWRASLASP